MGIPHGDPRCTRAVFGTLLLLGTSLSTMALAQTAPQTAATSNDIEEVTVTALRHDQPLQETPASIGVITGDELEATGVQNFSDVAKLIPNLNFNSYFRAGVPYLSMRGIPTSQGGEPPVAVLVDGAQEPGLDFINLDLIDISDIEVLRGPQGALYGRGAIAGAIVINTTQPTNDIVDKAVADYGNGNMYRVVNTLSGPIVPDKLWAKFTFEDKGFSGLIEDHGLNQPGDWYRENYGNLELLAKPWDGGTIELQASHLHGVDGASYLAMVPDTGGAITNFDDYYANRNLDTRDTRTVDHYIAKVDQDFGYATVTSVSQYADALSQVYGDADWTPEPVAVQLNNVQVRAFNQDLRITSPTDQPFQWFTGGFFQYRDTVNFLRVFSEQPGLLPPLSLAFSDEDQKSVAFAGYGQASLELPYNLKLAGALRFDVDERYDVDRSVVGSAVRQNFYAMQPSITLSEQFTPDIMGYLTWGKGFRSGGFNALEDTLAFPELVKREFPKETSENYEGGVKTEFLEHTITLNASVYHTDYTNEQYYFINVTPPSRDIISIGAVTINGAELEADYKPIPPLTISGSLGVADSNITSNDGPFLADKGQHSPNANTYNWDIGIQYELPLFDDYTLMTRLDYQELGPIYYNPSNLYDYDPTGYFNARVGVQATNFAVYVWGKNLTDTRSPTVYSPDAFGAGISSRQDNEPTSFGVEVTMQFNIPHEAPVVAAAPPPPAEVAVAPAPVATPEKQREFQVFFDFDKSNITDAAAHVIQAAADVVKAGGIAHITVTGHTDTVGTAKYNQGLSERRAASVKNRLVTDGVAASEITTIGAGKSGLLVPTADGVREPQNRRAVIELQ